MNPIVAGLPERVLLVRDNLVPGIPAPGGRVPSGDISLNYIPVPYPNFTPEPAVTIVQPAGSIPPPRFAGLADAPPTATRKLYFSEVLSDPNDPDSPTNFYITVDGQTPVLFNPNNPPSIVTTLRICGRLDHRKPSRGES